MWLFMVTIEQGSHKKQKYLTIWMINDHCVFFAHYITQVVLCNLSTLITSLDGQANLEQDITS